jgi:hypothetical protein
LKIKDNFKKACKIVNNAENRISLKMLSTHFHKWHYKIKVEIGMEVQSRQMVDKQRKLQKMKKW